MYLLLQINNSSRIAKCEAAGALLAVPDSDLDLLLALSASDGRPSLVVHLAGEDAVITQVIRL